MWTISVPLSIPISKNKNFSLNLNIYRNAHYRVLHTAKEKYTDLILDLLSKASLPCLDVIRFEIKIFPASARLFDIANVGPIVSKFFDDALVAAGVIPDDNYTHVTSYTYIVGSIDRANPRAEITIIPLSSYEKETTMQFKLSQETIESLVLEHVNSMIQVAEDVTLEISLEDDGTATVSLDKATAKTTPAPVKAKPVAKKEAPKPQPIKEDPVKEDKKEEAPFEPDITEEEETDPLDVPAVATDEVEEAEETPSAAPAKGLFANIKRPTN